MVAVGVGPNTTPRSASRVGAIVITSATRSPQRDGHDDATAALHPRGRPGANSDLAARVAFSQAPRDDSG